MTVFEAAALLRGLEPRLLEGLNPKEKISLLERAIVRRFPAGSLITREGFPADSMSLLVQGRARFSCTTIEGGTVLLRRIQPGDVCGLAAVLSHQVDYLMNAETERPSVALVWPRSAIRSFAVSCPGFIDNVLLLAYDYARWYRVAHVSAMGQTARQRLALVLGDLASGIGEKVEEGIEVNVRNEELANEANVTIFTASRLLSEWQRKGMLVKSRGKVMLRSTKDLLRREA
jgi:CRP/FNR family transcriptional regulator, nitrogen oxide reductase regulator